MQSYVNTSGLLLLIVPLVVTAALVGLSARPIERRNGWRYVTPGLGYWLPFLLGVGLSLAIGWVWIFIGSSRVDAAFQMRVAWWLAFVFALMSCWCAWRIFALRRQVLHWRGNKLTWTQSGVLNERSMIGATRVQRSISGNVLVYFSNGDQLRIDMAAHNSWDLIPRIEELNGLADPDAPPEH